MAQLGQTDAARLATCHERLRALVLYLAEHAPVRVLCGHRSKAEQAIAFATGKSKVQWPSSKHNREPSMAVDILPAPVDWDDRERMTLYAGFVLGVAAQMGIDIRWGGDWDHDMDVKDNRFDDLCHFELGDQYG